MSRLQKYFQKIISKGRKIFIPYITLGDPSFNTTIKIADILVSAGADALEIGIPFSDPLADGPTIQKAATRALRNNISIEDGFKFLKKFQNKRPVIFMSYLNPILTYGIKRFFTTAKKLNLAGVVIPDLPVEEAKEIRSLAKRNGVALSLFVSPTTSLFRAKIIDRMSDGFIYYISVTGVTGIREKLPSQLIEDLNTVKKIITKPLCLGFGISHSSQIKKIKKYVDGIIVGSAIVLRIENNIGNFYKMKKEIFDFANSLRIALDEEDIGS